MILIEFLHYNAKYNDTCGYCKFFYRKESADMFAEISLACLDLPGWFCLPGFTCLEIPEVFSLLDACE